MSANGRWSGGGEPVAQRDSLDSHFEPLAAIDSAYGWPLPYARAAPIEGAATPGWRGLRRLWGSSSLPLPSVAVDAAAAAPSTKSRVSSLSHGTTNRQARVFLPGSGRESLRESTDSPAFSRADPVENSRTWTIRLP